MAGFINVNSSSTLIILDTGADSQFIFSGLSEDDFIAPNSLEVQYSGFPLDTDGSFYHGTHSGILKTSIEKVKNCAHMYLIIIQ